ncbi:MAG: hypothetical protein L6R38_007347 [Xanthoria sp. 2 TBL-2021]|nr:MAG: hypothetical protein L6R38_007347 [Xanthoria sp. 2 TBL-2021]
MLRSRVVLDLLAARQAARQTGEQQLQAKSQPITRIRNRPALHTSSSPKVQSRPFHRQDVSTAAPRITTSGASSVILARLQARKERLAAACSSSDKASIPGKRETWATVRQRHATRPSGGASSKKPAPRQSLNAHRARQLPPVVEKLNKPARQVSPAASVMTGSSFSYIAPIVVAQATSSPRPLTPHAPRATRSRNVNCAPVPFVIPVKSSKVPLRGILKRDGQHRVTARRGLRWAEELKTVKIVDRWIGEPCAMDTPERPVKKTDHVHVDPTRYIGKVRGWTGPDGQDSYITGTEPIYQHAECGSPDCNKKGLHQFLGRYAYWKATGNYREDLPMGVHIGTFNKAYWDRQDIWIDAGLD